MAPTGYAGVCYWKDYGWFDLEDMEMTVKLFTATMQLRSMKVAESVDADAREFFRSLDKRRVGKFEYGVRRRSGKLDVDFFLACEVSDSNVSDIEITRLFEPLGKKLKDEHRDFPDMKPWIWDSLKIAELATSHVVA
jgi:hypothetical protein